MKNKEVQESLRQVGIRLIEEPPLLSPEPMSSPEAAVRVLGEWLSEMDRELFCVVNLNSNLTPINMNVVSMGALNVAYVHPRDAMKSAILSNAAYMMHNKKQTERKNKRAFIKDFIDRSLFCCTEIRYREDLLWQQRY